MAFRKQLVLLDLFLEMTILSLSSIISINIILLLYTFYYYTWLNNILHKLQLVVTDLQGAILQICHMSIRANLLEFLISLLKPHVFTQ